MRASHDATSRLKRVQTVLGIKNIPTDVVQKLECNEEFNTLTISVKSQLRRTARLYLEFMENN